MKDYKQAEIITVKSNGDSDKGLLTIFEKTKIQNFQPKRVYWTTGVPQGLERGNHAHKECIQVLFCLKGKIEVKTTTPKGHSLSFVLNEPNQGLILWPHIWHVMKYFDDAIQIVIASEEYSEADYLRSWELYKNYYS